ncbi:DUF6538 domain-containing protein [Flavimaribacter sediminis]|uniref:DUF6538 domain-containing protein n=1 Tax=Flavimaribacter sediminis TaxID=2865987 RepID=UPI00351F0314
MDVQSACHLYTKRGIYYFSRRVPKVLKAHYKHHRISLSLRTLSRKVAEARAKTLVAKLEEDWVTLRWRTSSEALRRFLVDHSAPDVTFTSSAPTLVEAKDLYLQAKSEGRPVDRHAKLTPSWAWYGGKVKLCCSPMKIHCFRERFSRRTRWTFACKKPDHLLWQAALI